MASPSEDDEDTLLVKRRLAEKIRGVFGDTEYLTAKNGSIVSVQDFTEDILCCVKDIQKGNDVEKYRRSTTTSPKGTRSSSVEELASHARNILIEMTSSLGSPKSKQKEMKHCFKSGSAGRDMQTSDASSSKGFSKGPLQYLSLAQMAAQQTAIVALFEQREFLQRQRKNIPKLIERTRNTGEMHSSSAHWQKLWDKEKIKPLREREQRVIQQCDDLNDHIRTIRRSLRQVRKDVHSKVARELVHAMNEYDSAYDNLLMKESSWLRRLQFISQHYMQQERKVKQLPPPAAFLPDLDSSSSANEEQSRCSMRCFVWLYAQASAICIKDGPLETHLIKWAQLNNGRVEMGPLKGIERAFQKSYENYAGDFTCIFDLARGSIEFGSVRDICRCLREIFRDPSVDVVRIKPRLSPMWNAAGSGGYRDVLVNITFNDVVKELRTHVVEVQLHLASFLNLKHAAIGGHRTYRVARTLRVFDESKTKPTISEVSADQLNGVAAGIVQVLDLSHLRLDRMEAQKKREWRSVCSCESGIDDIVFQDEYYLHDMLDATTLANVSTSDLPAAEPDHISAMRNQWRLAASNATKHRKRVDLMASAAAKSAKARARRLESIVTENKTSLPNRSVPTSAYPVEPPTKVAGANPPGISIPPGASTGDASSDKEKDPYDSITRSMLRAAREILKATPKDQMSYIVIKKQLCEIFDREDIEMRKRSLHELMRSISGVSQEESNQIEKIMKEGSVKSSFTANNSNSNGSPSDDKSGGSSSSRDLPHTKTSWAFDEEFHAITSGNKFLSGPKSSSRSQMRGLGVSQCKSIARGLDAGGRCLRVLVLKGCHVTDEGLGELLNYRFSQNLQHINLSYCDMITNDGIEAVASNCGLGLRVILLDSCTNISDDGLAALGSKCMNLAYVNLNRCSRITDAGVRCLMSSCRSIETLLLQGCKGLTNDALSAFVPALDDAPVHANLTKREHTDKTSSVIGRRRLSHMLFDLDTASKVEDGDQHSRLVHLDISLCRHFDDRALEVLSRSCGWLEEIRLDEASKISDAGILNLVTFCANLRFVSLNRCVKVTDDCITHLVEHCPYLAELNLWCCSNITDAALFTLGGVKYPSYEKMESKTDVSASNLRSLNLNMLIVMFCMRMHRTVMMPVTAVSMCMFVKEYETNHIDDEATNRHRKQ
eukprot:g806.t1